MLVGTESLLNYFQKVSGRKVALNLWYVDTRPNLQILFSSIWRSAYLDYKIQNILLVIFFSHN